MFHAPSRHWIISFSILLISLTATELPARGDKLSKLAPAEECLSSISTVRETLAPHRTKEDLTGFVGSAPIRCEEVAAGATICVFSLRKQDAGWRPLAEAVETRDRLNLVCEFPANDAPRSRDSCSVHLQRSNYRYYGDQIPKRVDASHSVAAAIEKATAAQASYAKQLLTLGRTAFELSTLVGDAPDSCDVASESFVCNWKATLATYGHGTLAMSTRARFKHELQMSCTLPLDGSHRAADSCGVAIDPS